MAISFEFGCLLKLKSKREGPTQTFDIDFINDTDNTLVLFTFQQTFN
jgi:hypothetical protein